MAGAGKELILIHMTRKSTHVVSVLDNFFPIRLKSNRFLKAPFICMSYVTKLYKVVTAPCNPPGNEINLKYLILNSKSLLLLKYNQ